MSKNCSLSKVTNVNQQVDKNNVTTVGCVLDWLDIRVKGTPTIYKLNHDGYCEELDKGCATHYHYFETELFSIAWDIKATYIRDTYSHFRVKNKAFYGFVGSELIDWVKSQIMDYFGSVDAYISRCDFAFDFPIKSAISQHFVDLFVHHKLGEKISKYALFRGKCDGREYVNFTAGNRGSRFFFRFYNKTIENYDIKNHCFKKQYIKDWHDSIFYNPDNDDIMRFEVEFKPQIMSLYSDFSIGYYFDDLLSHFVSGYARKCFYGHRYQPNEKYFTEKDFNQLKQLLYKLHDCYNSEVGLLGVSQSVDDSDVYTVYNYVVNDELRVVYTDKLPF